MFVKYVGRLRENDNGSPSMSRSALENHQSQPSLLVESVEVQGVHISGDPSYAVDVEGSVEVRDVGKIAISPVPSNPTKVQTKPPSTSIGLGRESQLQELSAQTTTSAAAKNAQPIPGGHEVKAGAPAVQKPNVSLGPLIPAPSVVPNIPYSVHPKPPSSSVAAAREPQPPSLLPPRTTCDAEKNAKKMPKAGELKGDKMLGAREVKAGAGTSKAKNVGTTTDDSNPYELDGAIDGLLEVGGTVAQPSLKKQKKIAHTAADDEALPMPPEEAPSKVRTTTRDICHRVPSAEGKKLLVFNVHSTLLDCSLFIDKNPNVAFSPTIRTEKCQVIFFPCLIEFLTKYFLRFHVAFWDTKSEVYMGEIVPAMLARMKHGGNFNPIFVWSGKECEVTEFEDGIPLAWGKPIQKVFWRYPDFSHSNTVMVDHNITRLGGIPSANLVIPTLFYVAELQKLGDDKAFLKGSLWPNLQGFYGS
jgi:hypothetical protein